MKKIIKIFAVFLSILLVLQMVIFLIARHGWKLFGLDNRNGGYSFVIEDDFKDIESIQLINKKEEKCIWSVENDN